MKIVICGNGIAPYCSERDYEYTLKEMGHEVVFLQEGQATGQQVLSEALKADALFWIHTWGRNIPGMSMKAVLKNLKRAKIPTFAYHLDLILPLHRQKEMRQTGYDQIDHFFTVEKDFADYLNRSNVAKGHYLPAAVIERDCFISKPDPAFKYDLIFTGSYTYHPEWNYRKKLLDWLYKTYGNKFHRWGHAGPDNPSPYVMGDKLNILYSSSKIVIGDSMCPGFTKEYYSSNRLMETTGKGGFLIYPYSKGLEDLYVLGKEIVVYGYNNFDDLKNQIEYYLANDTEREEIRKAGHERTKKDHTFTKRLDHMLKIVC